MQGEISQVSHGDILNEDSDPAEVESDDDAIAIELNIKIPSVFTKIKGLRN